MAYTSSVWVTSKYCSSCQCDLPIHVPHSRGTYVRAWFYRLLEYIITLCPDSIAAAGQVLQALFIACCIKLLICCLNGPAAQPSQV